MQLLTIKELSKLIKVKPSTLYAWAGKGIIPCLKLNSLLRFDLEEVERWINKSRHTAYTFPFQIKPANSINIDAVVKKAIDTAKRKKYNQTSGKPGRDQGLGKEA